MADLESSDLRFRVPLYALTEASRYLIVPRATLMTWANGYARQLAGGSTVKGQGSADHYSLPAAAGKLPGWCTDAADTTVARLAC
jgi:hypothetical protein